jgi:hypothetical protein
MAHATSQKQKISNIHILGLIGEKIYSNCMQNLGHKVYFNIDPFGYNDHETFFDEKTPTITQLKTISAYHKYDCWAIDAQSGKQVEHALKCEKMYIISVPVLWENEYNGWLLEVELNVLKSQEHIKCLPGKETKSLIIPRSNKYVRKIYKLTQQEEDMLLKYAVSEYAKKPSTYVKKKTTKKIPA